MMVLNVADDVNGTLSEKKKQSKGKTNGREKKYF